MVIGELAASGNPTSSEMTAAFEAILSGEAEPAQIGAFLMGLRMRGERVGDIVAGARVMRRHARAVSAPAGAVDTCGTGGLSWTSLNTSTAAAIVAASVGAIVAKHGNRSVPPKTGSADVLEALGVNLNASDAQIEECFRRSRLAFLFAPAHHSAMRHAGPVRKAIGIRTIFNLLGPLSNPAGAKRQVLGVYSPEWVEPYAQALLELGTERAWVVHGMDGIDEISTVGPTRIAEATPSGVRTFEVSPTDLGIARARLEDLRGGTPTENALALRAVVSGGDGPFADLVGVNAAAVLFVAEVAPDLASGLQMARAAMRDGRASATLASLVEASNA
jgi:anthranilate phosphoribosyltransferase